MKEECNSFVTPAGSGFPVLSFIVFAIPFCALNCIYFTCVFLRSSCRLGVVRVGGQSWVSPPAFPCTCFTSPIPHFLVSIHSHTLIVARHLILSPPAVSLATISHAHQAPSYPLLPIRPRCYLPAFPPACLLVPAWPDSLSALWVLPHPWPSAAGPPPPILPVCWRTLLFKIFIKRLLCGVLPVVYVWHLSPSYWYPLWQNGLASHGLSRHWGP